MTFIILLLCRCDIEQNLPRKLNKVLIEYEFVTYKNKEGDHSQEDNAEPTTNTEDDEDSQSKKGGARQFLGKVGKMVVSGVKTVGKNTIGKVLFKAAHRHLEIKKRQSCQIIVSDKGIDKNGNLRQSLSTTRLIRHVDIDKCDSVSISIKLKNCHLAKAHLFVRFV